MVADVYSYDFVRMIDLFEITNQVTFSADDLKFEPTKITFEDLSDEWESNYQVPVKATIADGILTVKPLAEGTAILNVTGKNSQFTYIYIEFMKIAGEWITFYEFFQEDEFDSFIN